MDLSIVLRIFFKFLLSLSGENLFLITMIAPLAPAKAPVGDGGAL
jgi:hypothetical protein